MLQVKTNKSELKTELRHILERREGRDRAITGKELARRFGHHDDRRLRQLIRELIAEGMPIAGNATGYFLVTSYAESRKYADSLKGRLIEDAKRRRDFRRAADCYLSEIEQVRLL